MLYLLALLPIVAYLTLLKALDAFCIIRYRRLCVSIIWGIISATLIYKLSRIYLQNNGTAWQGMWTTVFLEEAFKGILVIIMVLRRRIVFLSEVMIYGAAVGAGFAWTENIIYVSILNLNNIEALFRGIETALLHMGTTAMLSSMTLLLLHGRWTKNVSAILPLAVVTLIHGLHNLMIVPLMIQLLVIVAGILLIFWGITYIGDHQLALWLDISMEKQVKLLIAIREGKLLETNAGTYLQELKNRFEPEVMFDMIVYVQLYLELTLWAKGRMMLHEVGMDEELTSAKRKENEEKFKELQELTHRIPQIGHHLIKPIIMANDQDKWALRQYF